MFRTLTCLAVLAVSIGLARADEPQDFVYLGEKPVFLRVRVKVDNHEAREPFVAWLRAIFDRCDGDHDGVLNAAELANLPQTEKYRSAESTPKVRGMWKPDGNADGQVTFEELVEAVQTGVGGSISVRIAGYSTQQAPESIQAAGDENAAQVFKHLDVNRDKRLNSEEIDRALSSLRKFDRDDDDTFSQQELASNNPYSQFRSSTMRAGAYPLRPLSPFLHVSAYDVSTKAVRQLFNQYDKQPTDLQLTRDEFPISDATFLAHDANQDSRLDFDEILLLLRQATPQIELTLHVSDKWERNPAIEVECHDPALKDGVHRSPTGEVTINLGSGQMEISLSGANAFDAVQFLKQQYKSADGDNNGYVDKKESRNVYYVQQTFSQVDADNDEKVFLADVQSFVQDRQAAGLSRVVLDLNDAGRNLFEILDSNRDRRLSPPELESLKHRLAGWDADHDGQLGDKEVPQHFRLTARRGSSQIPGLNFAVGVQLGTPAVPTLSRAVGPTWFQKMDRNRDGEVSRREFIGPAEVFDRLDADKNSLVSSGEATALKP